MVEFGTSFGISTIYLAAAVRDNGGGMVIGTELEPSKHDRAVAHLQEAGLGEVAEVRLGDALATLKEVPEPLDLVFLDGWKDLYVPVLELLKPKLRPGAVVLGDKLHLQEVAAALREISSVRGERLRVGDAAELGGTEYSCYLVGPPTRGTSGSAMIGARARTTRSAGSAASGPALEPAWRRQDLGSAGGCGSSGSSCERFGS